MKSSKTLDQGSTGTKKGCKPFWTESCNVLSQKLSSVIETYYAELNSNSWNTSLRNVGQNSWFSLKVKDLKNKNCKKTYYSSLPSLSLDITGDEPQIIKNEGNWKCKKIKLHPTKK